MRRILAALLLTLAALAWVAPALAQEAAQDTQAVQAQADREEGQAQAAPDVARPLERLTGKIEALAVPLVGVAILVGAVVLMVSPMKGKTMLGFILLAGLLLLGGWRYLVDFLRYILAP
ncbi:MAG: hypothetical protein ACPLRW_11615 [Moorellales bacterium]